MEKKYLGKINKVQFGLVGYQEAMFGLSLDFSFDGCCCIGTTISGGWNNSIECSVHCKWTEEDRNKQRAEMCQNVNQLLLDAKVQYVDQLAGKPVELTLEGQSVKDFRILTEVL
jgi:hypothetical protein